MDKPILFYDVRVQTSRVTGGTLYLPAIVEREEAVPLDVIIERAIDRGLIAGIKPSAAKQIADAIAQQMYEEFRAGRGVKFGNYFYARLYLDGTSDSDGKLTSANGINVRFANGTGFRLTMDMFSFSNVNGGDIPGTDFLISEADGAERGSGSGRNRQHRVCTVGILCHASGRGKRVKRDLRLTRQRDGTGNRKNRRICARRGRSKAERCTIFQRQ